MKKDELRAELFEKYGVALTEDDPAWLIFQIHTDLTENILASIEKVKSLGLDADTMKKEINKSISSATHLINQVATLQQNIDNSITVHKDTIDNSISIHKQSVKDYEDELNIIVARSKQMLANAASNIDMSEVISMIEKQLQAPVYTLSKNLSSNFDETRKLALASQNLMKTFISDIDQTKNSSIRTFEKLENASIKSLEKIEKKTNSVNRSINRINWLHYGLIAATFFALGASTTIFHAYDVSQKIWGEKQQAELADLEKNNIKLLDEIDRLDETYASKAKMIKKFIDYEVDIVKEDGKEYIQIKSWWGKKGVIFNPANNYGFVRIK